MFTEHELCARHCEIGTKSILSICDTGFKFCAQSRTEIQSKMEDLK